MVPVNFSVSLQGNATWVILTTTNTRRRSRKILFAARGGEEDICQNIFSVRRICLHSDFFISRIQRLFSSTRYIDYFMVGERVRFLFTSCEESQAHQRNLGLRLTIAEILKI